MHKLNYKKIEKYLERENVNYPEDPKKIQKACMLTALKYKVKPREILLFIYSGKQINSLSKKPKHIIDGIKTTYDNLLVA